MKGWVCLMLVASLAGACGGAAARTDASAQAPSSVDGPSRDGEAWRQERPAVGTPRTIDFPAPQSWTLANGLSIYCVPRSAGVVHLRLVTRHGESSAPLGQSGVAALTARLMTEGTRRHSDHELAKATEALGSSLEAWAERDSSAIALATFPDTLEEAIALLAEVVTQPALDPKAFERVRGEWLDHLRNERQDPERLASLAGLRVLNGAHHGAPVHGTPKTVRELTLHDLRTFHAAAYSPTSSALFLVGDVDPEAIKDTLARTFGAWRPSSEAGLDTVPPVPEGPEQRQVVFIHRPGAVQTAIFVGQRFPKRSEPGHERRQVMGNAVGGLFTSRININLREQHGYTYGAYGRPVATRHWGAFVVTTSVRNDATAPALHQIFKELEHASQPERGVPLTSEEVGRAKAALLHSLGSTLEHSARVLASISDVFVHGLPASYFSSYPDVLVPISVTDVQRSAARLNPSQAVVVLVGDEHVVKPSLEQAGFAVLTGDDALIQ